MPTYLLTDQVFATELWAALETNPSYSQNLTSKATVAKNAAGTYFKYRPGVTVTATGNFPDIALAKSGWTFPPPIILRQQNYTGGNMLYSGDKIRAAQKITLNATIAKISFLLVRVGSPTQLIYARIRKTSDDSIIATSSTTVDSSTVPTTPTWYDFPFSNVAVNEEVYLSVEHSGTDTNNCIVAYYYSPDICTGVSSTYITSWTDSATADRSIKVYAPNQVDTLNGSFASGNWTFKVALYNNTKYGHAVKIAARLSRSVNADGSSATLIGAVTESPNTITLAGAAGNIQTDSWTYNPSAVTLTNEYLFVEYRCVIVTAATNVSAGHSFICDENPATRLEEIITTTFTPGGPITGWRKLQYLAEPPTTGAFNKLRCASEPPVSGAWNKLLYDGE